MSLRILLLKGSEEEESRKKEEKEEEEKMDRGRGRKGKQVRLDTAYGSRVLPTLFHRWLSLCTLAGLPDDAHKDRNAAFLLPTPQLRQIKVKRQFCLRLRDRKHLIPTEKLEQR